MLDKGSEIFQMIATLFPPLRAMCGEKHYWIIFRKWSKNKELFDKFEENEGLMVVPWMNNYLKSQNSGRPIVQSNPLG